MTTIPTSDHLALRDWLHSHSLATLAGNGSDADPMGDCGYPPALGASPA